MSVSTLFADASQAFLICSDRVGLAVDIKKSTYKNLAKLLKAFEKKVTPDFKQATNRLLRSDNIHKHKSYATA